MKNELARWKSLLAIAWPLIIANSFWNLQLTIDRILLGIYSTESLGAAMAVMGVFWVPMALLQGTAASKWARKASAGMSDCFEEYSPSAAGPWSWLVAMPAGATGLTRTSGLTRTTAAGPRPHTTSLLAVS